MTAAESKSILRERNALLRQVRRQQPFVEWIHMHARHALFCPRRKGKPCTCGLAGLDRKYL